MQGVRVQGSYLVLVNQTEPIRGIVSGCRVSGCSIYAAHILVHLKSFVLRR